MYLLLFGHFFPVDAGVSWTELTTRCIEDMLQIHATFLVISCVTVFISLCISTFLIFKHQKYMTRLTIQPKIVGILWMVPIYSITSLISLFMPKLALYFDMIRDCYEVQ